MGDGSDLAADVGALAAEVFADSCPPAEIRRLMGARQGYDRATWRRWARETGLAGIGAPEQHGGGGFTMSAVADVFEAAGRSLVCAPLLSTVGLAVPLLLASRDEPAMKRWLPALCDGDATAAAVTPNAAGVRAEPAAGGGWVLTGDADRVVDGASADLLLVVADAPDGSGLFAVEPTDAGPQRHPLMSLDLTRRQAAVTFAAVPAVRIGQAEPQGWIDTALDTARVLLAAELVGVAQQCLGMTVAYASQRIQFGRPIGSFQAVKQRAADMLIKIELARSAARHAAEAVDLDAPDRAVSAALAKAFCAETAVAVAAEAIQLHGGIGFTWEHDAHLYFKRALTDDELLGSSSALWDRVSEHLDHAV